MSVAVLVSQEWPAKPATFPGPAGNAALGFLWLHKGHQGRMGAAQQQPSNRPGGYGQTEQSQGRHLRVTAALEGV